MSAREAIEIASGLGFVEGPVIARDGSLVVTSLTHGRLYRVRDGQSSVLAELGGGANGAVEGAGGTFYVAQMGSRSWARNAAPMTGGIQQVSPDGAVRWLTMDPVSPNDLCFGPDGLLYWTDPTRDRTDDGRLWRMDPTGVPESAELLTSVPWYPNGIAFGPDDAVYLASYHERTIVRCAVSPAGLGRFETVIRLGNGQPDGLAFDSAGNLIIGANDPAGGRGQIQTWTTEGVLIDAFEPGPGSYYTNVALGTDRTLYITHSDGGRVLRVDGWPTAGLPLHPFRVG